MPSDNIILLKIKPVWESSNTFELADKLVNGTKRKVDDLNKSYRDQTKSIGQLKDKIGEWRGEQEKSFRSDHIKKYGQLIDGAKKKIDELEGSAKTCREKTQSLFGSVFGANLATKALGMLKNSVSGFTRDSVDAYQRHSVALAQLGQVMKNTMNAGKWDVDSVVAVTKAQQKLGVVSSDVQLAGAKELGTYIKKKESLEKLIPTMNDMLAHQYGLNASQENAQGIAQMMGKVLEGQVNALSRNGYSFTEAQEKILKYGSESQRTAVLADVIAQSVEGVNQALAATPEGKARQIAMEYDEVRVQIGELVTKLKGDLLGSLQKVTLTLYDNRKLILGVAKATASTAVAFGAYKIVVSACNKESKIYAAVTATKTFAKKLFTGQLHLATRAQLAFNAATKANIIGAIAGAVLAAASAFALFRKRGKEATDTMKEAKEAYSSFYAQERTQLDMIFAKLRQTNPKSEERKRLVRELAELYPELNKQTLNDITNTNNLAAAYDTLIASIQKKAWAKSKEVALEEAYKGGDEGEALIRTLYPNLSEKELIAKAKSIIKRHKTRGGTLKSQYGEVDFGRYTGNIKKVEQLVNSRGEADRIAKLIGSESIFNAGSGNTTNTNTTNNYTSTASDAITGGGKQVKNFYITIGNLIGENTNMFQSSKDDPQSAQDFMSKMSEALQMVVNDVNYAAV